MHVVRFLPPTMCDDDGSCEKVQSPELRHSPRLASFRSAGHSKVTSLRRLIQRPFRECRQGCWSRRYHHHCLQGCRQDWWDCLDHWDCSVDQDCSVRDSSEGCSGDCWDRPEDPLDHLPGDPRGPLNYLGFERSGCLAGNPAPTAPSSFRKQR
jgi:hypothetical protein